MTEFDLGDEDSSLRSSNVFVEFAPDGRLLVADRGELVSIEPATGQSTPLAEGVGMFSQNRDGSLILSRRSWGTPTSVATFHDLVDKLALPLTSHGDGVASIALDTSGTVAVTGSIDGVVRVGPASGSAPQWLVGHIGARCAHHAYHRMCHSVEFSHNMLYCKDLSILSMRNKRTPGTVSTKYSAEHSGHRTRAKPDSCNPQSRYRLTNGSTNLRQRP